MDAYFRELVDKNIEILNSVDFQERDDAETTLPTIKKLIELNKCGILTFDSQVGTSTTTPKYEIIERAYINGYMLKEKAYQLQEILGKQMSDKVLIVLQYSKEAHIDVKSDIPLTIIKKKRGHTQKIEIATHMSTAIPKSIFKFEAKQFGIKNEYMDDMVMVFLFDPTWNRLTLSKNGLLKELLELLQ
jgi:hypothetical protein